MNREKNISDVLEKLRPNMRELPSYQGGAQLTLDKFGEYVKINQNESPYPPAPSICKALMDFIQTGHLNRYSPGDHTKIAEVVARYNNVKSEQIAFGNGSDEILDIISVLFLDGSKDVYFPYPDYSMFQLYCHSQNAHFGEVDINPDFTLPIEKIAQQKGDVTFISNPHAPSGRFTPIDEIEKLCDMLFPNVLVIDEAYVEFSSDNCVRLIEGNPNLIITRTLSKAFGLPSLRIGYAIAHERLIERMNAKRLPYNISWFAYIAVLEAFKDEAIKYTREKIDKIRKGREYLSCKLRSLGFHVYSSQANFVLATPPPYITPQRLFDSLREMNILVRYFGYRRMLENSIRITVGTEEENQKLIDGIYKLLKC